MYWPQAPVSRNTYDFGSSTELQLHVTEVRKGRGPDENVTLLSRNHPYHYLCQACQENDAEYLLPWGYDNAPSRLILCQDCADAMFADNDELDEDGMVVITKDDGSFDSKRAARDERIQELWKLHPDAEEDCMRRVCNSRAYEAMDDGQFVPDVMPVTGPLASK